MESEIQGLLQTLDDGLKALPPIASDAFETLVKGVFTEGVIGLTYDLAMIIIFSLILWFCHKFSNKESLYNYNNYGNEAEMKTGYVIIFAIFIVISVTMIIISIVSIPFDLRSVISPEYIVIKKLMGMY